MSDHQESWHHRDHHANPPEGENRPAWRRAHKDWRLWVAVGLMLLLPSTATRFGVSNPYDPRENVHAGARYLKFLIDRFGHDVRLALAAYNAGEEAVERNGGQIPPFSETMAYVPRVLKIYQMLRDQMRAI